MKILFPIGINRKDRPSFLWQKRRKKLLKSKMSDGKTFQEYYESLGAKFDEYGRILNWVR